MAAADDVAKSLYHTFVLERSGKGFEQAQNVPPLLKPRLRVKIDLYREALLLLALGSESQKDKQLQQVLHSYEALLFGRTPTTSGMQKVEASRTAMGDLSGLLTGKDQRGLNWAMRWFADIGHSETNPTRLTLFASGWMDDYIAVMKMLKTLGPSIAAPHQKARTRRLVCKRLGLTAIGFACVMPAYYGFEEFIAGSNNLSLFSAVSEFLARLTSPLSLLFLIVAVVLLWNSRREVGAKIPRLTQQPRILLFTPYRDQSDGISLFLGRGYSVRETGRDTLLEEMRSGRFDAVIIDLCDSYADLHIDEFLSSHPRVLFLTCDHPTHGILLPQGYRAVVEKPIELRTLTEKLEELLAEARAQRGSGT